jgi:aspartyl-tRNA synthetase
LLQVVTGPWEPESYEVLKGASIEDVIQIEGTVAARPEKLVNPNIPSGTVELQAKKAVILSHSEIPPFEVNNDTAKVDEELRLKYRYLDLRTERMHKNIVNRAKAVKFIRAFLDERDFTEV